MISLSRFTKNKFEKKAEDEGKICYINKHNFHQPQVNRQFYQHCTFHKTLFENNYKYEHVEI